MLKIGLIVFVGLVTLGWGMPREENSDVHKQTHGRQLEQTTPGSKPDRKLFGKSEQESYRGRVVVIKVGEYDLMNKKSFTFWRKMIRRADEDGARALVFELDTPGGLAFETAEIISQEMRQMKTPTFAFVNPNAISAGAMISMGTEVIYMAPGAVIGSAAVVSGDGREIEPKMRAKIEALMGAYMRTTVKNRGHRVDVAEAMMFVDEEKEREFAGVTVKKGGLLTLTAEEAVQVVNGKPLLAKGIVSNLEGLLKAEGLDGVEVVRAELTGFEKIAWWIGLLSPVLIMVGLGGGYIELKTPGFGVGGVISLSAFTLFFFGNYVAGNLAGYELAVLFLLGLALILIEVFVLPGLIIPGLLGVVLVGGTLFLAMVDEFAFEDVRHLDHQGLGIVHFFQGALWRLSFGFIGSLVLLGILMKYFSKIPFLNQIILEQAIASPGGEMLGNEQNASTLGAKKGDRGVAMTDLRPVGKILLEGGEALDVTLGEGFVNKGESVEIVKKGLLRTVVKKMNH